MNTAVHSTSIFKKVFYGWWVVAAGTLLYALGIGSVFYGFNTFYSPMKAEFGWSGAVTSGAYSLSRLEGGVEGPIVGPLIDKYGARKVAFVGIVLAAIGFFALTRVNSNILTLYLIFGLLLSMGYNTGFFHPTTTATANWFIRKRSRALSYVTSGGGIGGAVMVPLLAWLIVQFGWRSTAVIAGAAMLILGLPLVFVLRSRPEDKGLLPDGEVVAQPLESTSPARLDEMREQFSATDAIAGEIDFTLREALRTSTFWIYVAAMMFRACILSSLVVHEIPHLESVGFSYQTAANALGAMTLVSVPGRLGFGWLGDRIDKRLLLLITCLLQAAGIFILTNATTLPMVYFFVVVYGLGYGGAIPLTIAFRGELFGRRIFATIGGVTTAMTAIATVGSPVFAGYLYDVSQSYRVPFYIFMVLICVAGVIFLMVRRPRPPARLRGTSVGS